MSVAGAPGTVDAPAADVVVAGAVKGIIFRHHALLQSGGQHQSLKGGAGLIGILHGTVAPLLLTGRALGLSLGLLLKLRVGELLLGGLGVVFRLQLLVDRSRIGLYILQQEAVANN